MTVVKQPIKPNQQIVFNFNGTSWQAHIQTKGQTGFIVLPGAQGKKTFDECAAVVKELFDI